MTAANAEVDVAVVGAGAAGLAAGTALAAAGASYVVLEARARIGGRAYTDTETFPGLPFDHGCHWLHSASLNPLRQIADRLGYAYDRDSSWLDRALFVGPARQPAGARQSYGKSFVRALEAIKALGAAGKDVAAAEALDPNDPWLPLIRHIFVLITAGMPEEVSAVDYFNYRDTEEDYPVERGYGALIAEHARGVAVRTSTPVTAIGWSGAGVRLETASGSLRAKAAVVTVSTTVLADHRIRFTPALPVPMQEACAALRLGVTEKIALRLSAPIDAVGSRPFLSFMDDGTTGLAPVNCYVNPFGRPMLLAHTGGSYAREIHAGDGRAAIAYLTDVLVTCFGADMRQRITGACATNWAGDPYIGGGYSFLRPGNTDARARLAEPIGDRVFLAGEAVSPTFFSTAHGAHLTGIEAAARALAVVRRP